MAEPQEPLAQPLPHVSHVSQQSLPFLRLKREKRPFLPQPLSQESWQQVLQVTVQQTGAGLQQVVCGQQDCSQQSFFLNLLHRRLKKPSFSQPLSQQLGAGQQTGFGAGQQTGFGQQTGAGLQQGVGAQQLSQQLSFLNRAHKRANRPGFSSQHVPQSPQVDPQHAPAGAA